MSDLTQVGGVLRFTVFGKAKPAGSKRAFIYQPKAGGKPKTAVVDANVKAAVWKQEVALAARAAYAGPLLLGSIRLALTFYRPRPQSHYGTGKNAGEVKESAAKWPIGRPDTVKLTRAVEDALTGVLWRDDSQVVEHLLRKVYGECSRVEVEVQVLDS